MQPEQQQAGGMVPGPANQYDFIVNPPQKQPPKSKLPLPNLGSGGGGSNKKFFFLAGGGLGFVVLLLLIVLVFSGGNADVDRAVGLAQSQQELIRVGELGDEAIEQRLKSSAMTAQLTLTTQQQQWLSYLSGEGRQLSNDELALKEDPDTDSRIETARQSATFDSAYEQILDSHLKSYAQELSQVHSQSSEADVRELAAAHFEQLELLVKQLEE